MEGLLTNIGNIIQNQGWVAFPLCFLGGIVSSASPCVLAMIPLVMGFVGGYAGGSRKKAIQYSLLFTLGLTLTFVALGIIATLLGTLFGNIGAFWRYAVPVLAILLGLQLWGLFKINSSISERFLPRKKAFLGAFLMGLVFGIIASPCATPVLGVILTFAAAKQNVAYSGGLLLAYAVGHWILVLGAGISVGFAQRILESKGIANLSKYTKKIAGAILIGVGVYLIISLFL
jgi:cytochrome c-type biogenesis protein